MEIVFRLFLAGFVILAPSALFVLFVKGLDRLRDDQLVDQILDQLDEQGGQTAGPGSVLTGGMAPGRPSTSFEGTGDPCPNCGLPNPDVARYCGNCLTKLSGRSNRREA